MAAAGTTHGPGTALAHQPALDGVRAVAILIVLGIHAPAKVLRGGYIGVTVFFVLSGYLITTLLARELVGGRLDLRRFYRRRFARLAPGLAVSLAGTAVVAHFVAPGATVTQAATPLLASLFYVMNLLLAHAQPLGPHRNFYSWTWSLAVEEQFYLLWPLALMLAYRRAPRAFILAAAALAVGCALVALDASQSGIAWQPHAYFGSDSNATPLLTGSLLALCAPAWSKRPGPVGSTLLGWTALTALALLATADTSRLIGPMIVAAALIATALVFAVTSSPDCGLSAGLGHPVLRWVGQRAYSLYLWNIALRALYLHVLGAGYLVDLLWIVTSLVVADASYRLVEVPGRARLSGRGARSSRDASPGALPTEPLGAGVQGCSGA